MTSHRTPAPAQSWWRKNERVFLALAMVFILGLALWLAVLVTHRHTAPQTGGYTVPQTRTAATMTPTCQALVGQIGYDLLHPGCTQSGVEQQAVYFSCSDGVTTIVLIYAKLGYYGLSNGSVTAGDTTDMTPASPFRKALTDCMAGQPITV